MIMRVFGIPLWSEKLSDEQYIERIRKRVKMRRRLRYLQGVMAAAVLGMTIWLVLMFIQLLKNLNDAGTYLKHGHPTSDQQPVYIVFGIAIMFGFMFGFYFYKVIFFIVEAFSGLRQEQLLVECWDALSDAEKTRLRQRSS